MRKTIKIDKGKEIKINTSWNWAYIYQEYFGHDIIPDLVPAIDAFISMFNGLVAGEEIDQDRYDLYGLEITTVTNVVWALAKNADDDIPDIREWLDQFDIFPMDIIVPEVVDALATSMMSTKKAELLREEIALAASRLTQSLSPQQTED